MYFMRDTWLPFFPISFYPKGSRAKSATEINASDDAIKIRADGDSLRVLAQRKKKETPLRPPINDSSSTDLIFIEAEKKKSSSVTARAKKWEEEEGASATSDLDKRKKKKSVRCPR